jgi:hypothetical protein
MESILPKVPHPLYLCLLRGLLTFFAMTLMNIRTLLLIAYKARLDADHQYLDVPGIITSASTSGV